MRNTCVILACLRSGARTPAGAAISKIVCNIHTTAGTHCQSGIASVGHSGGSSLDFLPHFNRIFGGVIQRNQRRHCRRVRRLRRCALRAGIRLLAELCTGVVTLIADVRAVSWPGSSDAPIESRPADVCEALLTCGRSAGRRRSIVVGMFAYRLEKVRQQSVVGKTVLREIISARTQAELRERPLLKLVTLRPVNPGQLKRRASRRN